MAGEALVRAPNPDPPSGVGRVVDQSALRPTAEEDPLALSPSGRVCGVLESDSTVLQKSKKRVRFAHQKSKERKKKAKKNVATPQKFYDIPKNEVSGCPYDIPK